MRAESSDPVPHELRLSIAGPHGREWVYALYDWLTYEDMFRGRLELRAKRVPPGAMGGRVDVLAVAVASGGAAAALASSLSTWLLTRKHADVMITVRTPDGREVTIDVRRARNPETIIREVQALLSPVSEATTVSNTIVAGTTGPTVQAGTIQGDVHFHSDGGRS